MKNYTRKLERFSGDELAKMLNKIHSVGDILVYSEKEIQSEMDYRYETWFKHQLIQRNL